MMTSGTDSIELVRFRIGSIRYVLPVSSVAAILDLSAVEPDPDGVWSGWIQGRNQAIRVANGRRVFLEPDQEMPAARVIVIRAAMPFGVIVDEVLGSRSVTESDIRTLPGSAGSTADLLVSSVVWNVTDVDLLLDEHALRVALWNPEPVAERSVERSARTVVDLAGSEILDVAVGKGSERIALPVSVVRHVAQYRRPQAIARAAEDVLGLLSWQRQPVPLISTLRRMGLHDGEEASGQIVVVGPSGADGEPERPATAALLVNQVYGIQVVHAVLDEYVHTLSGDKLRFVDPDLLLTGRYLADNRATVLVSQPMPSMEIVT